MINTRQLKQLPEQTELLINASARSQGDQRVKPPWYSPRTSNFRLSWAHLSLSYVYNL